MARPFLSALFAAALVASASPAAAAPKNETPLRFAPTGGEPVDAMAGSLTVPERWGRRSGKTIEIHYVRFPSTGPKPGAPIVYLAGGPGGSGIEAAKGPRFALFMAMREFGDVIALDQRGAGASDHTPECVSDVVIPAERRVASAEERTLLRKAAEECAAFWRAAGHDIAGYTTAESARDLEALRRHLGAKKLTLWGISYGTHLALAAARNMGPKIDRLVLASVEGLDQTVKLPSETDAYFGRLQAAIDQEPAAKAAYPDAKALIRRVHAALDAEPVMLTVKTRSGDAKLLLTREVMQRVASALIADPDSASRLLMLYLAADQKFFDPIGGVIGRFSTPGAPERFRLMPLAMDIASGVGAARTARIDKEAATALLGEALNYPMPQLDGALGLDLGDTFRTLPKSAAPALVLMGTLDGRTYPDEQRAAVKGLARAQIVTVVNAGHNLLTASPDVTEAIRRFMRGEPAAGASITVPAPRFAPQAPYAPLR